MESAFAWEACLAGLRQVIAWPELGLLALGVVAGGLVGILPGLGGAATVAMLLPLTLTLPTTQAFALLLGIAAVVATTGDLTSILVGIPGEPIAAATVVDGHPMAIRGEGARAIGASLFSSLAGSIVGALTLGLSIPLALFVARSIASPELFMLALLGISYIAPLAGVSRLRGLAAGCIGLFLATVGLDPLTATPRFTFGLLTLWDGIGPAQAALGLFAIPEIVALAAKATAALPIASVRGRLSDGVRDVGRMWPLVLRSSAIGTVLGLLPGVGASVSQWMAYGNAARRSPEDVAFGRGAVEGVIAPSAANNATLGGSLVPALSLGIPGGLLSALLLSGLIMKGLVPGPTMLAPEAEGGHLSLVFVFVWLLVIANILAVGLSCISTDILVRVTRVPPARIVPFLLVLTFVGAFAERRSFTDLVITTVMGGLGLAMARYNWPRGPVLMGLVLGRLAENRLFLSIDAYGLQWLWRPGVIAIGAFMIAGLIRSGRRRDMTSAVPEIQDRPASGEPLFVAAIIASMTIALILAGTYLRGPALFPLMTALSTIGLLVAAFLVDPSLHAWRKSFAVTRNAAIRWIPVFLFLIWALGFVFGAPLAVLGYLLLASGQRPTFAVTGACASGLFLYLVLDRLLSVGFPAGALLVWARLAWL